MSKHTQVKPKGQFWGQTMVAPEGVRLSGPGTRSKNPYKYDKNAHLAKKRA